MKYQKLIPPLFMLPLASALIVYAAYNLAFSDAFVFRDSLKIPQGILPLQLFDIYHITDTLTIKTIVNIVVTTVTSIITVIGVGTCNGSCFVNTSSTLTYALTAIVIPLIFLIITGFGFIYMGARFFGVLVIVESFVFLGLAYAGIIPPWFTLLIVIFVGAAMTKIVLGLFREK